MSTQLYEIWRAPNSNYATRRLRPDRPITNFSTRIRAYRGGVTGTVASAPVVDTWDFDDTTTVAWGYTSTSQFTASWPAGTNIVDIQTGSSDFYTNLQNTVNAAGTRVVVRLAAGVYHLNQFRMIGASGDPTYAYGFWFPNLQGFLGQGADQTFIQMDANSCSQAQLDRQMGLTPKPGTTTYMTSASFDPIQMGFCRMDGLSASSPILIAGVTFRGADQQLLTQVASDVPAVMPQPAAYNGLVLYPGTYAQISYTRFQAAGSALTSSPPFETGNAGIQRGNSTWDHCEFDGRLSPVLNSARPRRVGVWMGNNETYAKHSYCYFHHSKVSRYAVNDQNLNTSGTYIVEKSKFEQITNTQGDGKGGYTNASLLGYESTNAAIYHNDVIYCQDNPYTNGQAAQDIQFTTVGSRDPVGGRCYITRGTFRCSAFTQLDGFLTFRITNSAWMRDGYATTLKVVGDSGQTKSALVIPTTVAWPPSQAYLTSIGANANTHYLVRNN